MKERPRDHPLGTLGNDLSVPSSAIPHHPPWGGGGNLPTARSTPLLGEGEASGLKPAAVQIIEFYLCIRGQREGEWKGGPLCGRKD